jgi:hypothetical protein
VTFHCDLFRKNSIQSRLYNNFSGFFNSFFECAMGEFSELVTANVHKLTISAKANIQRDVMRVNLKEQMKNAGHRGLKNSLALRLWALLVALGLSFGAAAQSASSADAAIAVAQQWLAVADADKAAAMWEQSSPLMQKKEDQAYWVNYIATMRNTLGSPASQRVWVALEREIDNPALPPGEFTSVTFVSPFSKTRAWEKVALIRSGNQWVPVGFQYGAIQATPAPAK